MLWGDLFRKIVKGTLAAARTSSGEFLLRKTDYGLIHVEYAVVKKIAERALSDLRGVSNLEVEIEKTLSTTTPFRINLSMTLAEGYSAPRTSEEADRKINEALRSLLEMNFYVPVAVKVKLIEQVVTKRRRVR